MSERSTASSASPRARLSANGRARAGATRLVSLMRCSSRLSARPAGSDGETARDPMLYPGECRADAGSTASETMMQKGRDDPGLSVEHTRTLRSTLSGQHVDHPHHGNRASGVLAALRHALGTGPHVTFFVDVVPRPRIHS